MGNQEGKGRKSVAEAFPYLVEEWHSSKNGDLQPTDVSWGSARKVWWVCSLGHEWETSPNVRSRPSGCPVCAGQVLLEGFNDMATTRPDLAAEWHPSKNGDLKPSDVVAGASKSFWWLCSKGHEWKQTGNQRDSGGSGCPVCSGRQVLPGYNDMGTTRPDLAAEWHPSKNGDLHPSKVTKASNRRAWWQCSQGHEWQARINQRSAGNTGCPVCTGQMLVLGITDLATTNPNLAAQWHPTKNGVVTPQDVIAGTSRQFWWQCSLGHEWRASGNSRQAGGGKGCPVCSGQKVLTGFNDMATTRPDLAGEWHPSKNSDLTPQAVLAGTSKKIWWLCKEGHEWQVIGQSRAAGTGCPICATFGFDPTKPSVLYFIENQALAARKVGITNRGTTRLRDFTRQGWATIHLVHREDGYVIREVERRVLSWIRVDLGLPAYLEARDMRRLGGWSETFSADGPSDAEIISRIIRSIDELSGDTAP